MNLAHLHLILVHFPVVGSVAALGLLVRAYFVRSRESFSVAAIATLLVTLTAIGAFATGEGAEHILEKIGTSESAIESHEAAAYAALVSVLFAGFLAIVLVVGLWIDRMERVSVLARHGLLIALVVSVCLIGVAAQRGGAIRHTEVSVSSAVVQPSDTQAADTAKGAETDDD
ncbi:MAG: hypothetical protein JNM27_03850 [Leptospirales bacterium]|nr:hypothetical protein [Leptospirales bacterium]